ncbi:hypothetical protein JRO89_XS04G0189200 [Xanthoceras sorbifolium]|uniref:Glycosyl transferase family 28 C-terminal domain-containing protein n=1 Tax=Xanthoceras sorbifolium TaxID=99658 RepID=A0ABQ8I5X2_9ROSI|nr:hypothetical protein JRO89_XS04G0189200 [Xanthoceras sorbifolium]
MGDTADGLSSKRTVFVTVGTTCFDALVKAMDTLEVQRELSRRGYTHLLIQMGRGTYEPAKVYLTLVEWLFASSFSAIVISCSSEFLFSEVVMLLVGKSLGEDGSVAVEYFRFSSSIADHLRSASLVISHADQELKCIMKQLEVATVKRSILEFRLVPSLQLLPSLLFHVQRREENGVKKIKGLWVMRSGSIFETLRLAKPLIVVVNEDLMDNHQSELAEELAERKHLYCAHPQTLHQVIACMDLESLLPYHSGDATPVAKLINRYLGFPED